MNFSSREILVSDHLDRGQGGNGERRGQQKDGTLPDVVAEGAHEAGSERVADCQIARVAAESFAEAAVADQRETQRRDRWT